MARTLTNFTSMAVARQSAFDTLGGSPTWYTLEPNGSITFGPEVTTTARDPISKNRQARKGAITDLDSSVSMEADLTIDSLTKWADLFFFSAYVNTELVFEGANTATTSTFSVPALTSTQSGKLQYNAAGKASLLWAAGYTNTDNNGLHVLAATASTSATSLTVGTTLVVETAPTKAELTIAGVRAEAGDFVFSISGVEGTLTSNNGTPTSAVDFTTLGLTVGQFVHVGGVTSATQGKNSSGNAVAGFGRITSIAANTLKLDKLSSTLEDFDGTDTGAGGTDIQIDLLFGRFVRNVSVDSAEFLEQYVEIEVGSPNLYETTPPTSVANPNGYEYALNNLCDSLEFNFGLTSLATLTPSLIGTDTESPVDDASRKTNASSAVAPLHTAAFNTTSDYARLRITDVDETGLTTDFKDWTLTLSNNVSGEKVQGYLGSKYLNTGNFGVEVSGTFLFSNPSVPARIRANTRVTMDLILENADGAFAIDLPSMTLSSDGRDYPVNESVTISVTGTAFEDPTLGTSGSISLFPVTPTSYAS
jgi:hypothetical protein